MISTVSALSRTLVPAPQALAAAPAPAPVQDVAEVSAPSPSFPTAEALAALAVGPIPDFAPMSGIVTHALVGRLSKDMVARLGERLGVRHAPKEVGYCGRSGFADMNLVWMRDYAPTFVRKADGTTEALKFLTPDPIRARYVGASGMPGVGGPSPEHRLYKDPANPQAEGSWLITRTVPLQHQGGNQIATGRHVFVSDRILAENARNSDRLQGTGYQPRTAEEVVHELAVGLGVADEQIVVLPSMPGEATKHVDLYLLALGPDRVVIPEIRNEALDAAAETAEKEMGAQASAFLDERAEQLRGLGYQVDRLPMLAPMNISRDMLGNFSGVFWSPANSILQNMPEGRSVLLPTFDTRRAPEPLKRLNQAYTEVWKAYFQAAGWEPDTADATALGQGHGLFRCSSQPIPLF